MDERDEWGCWIGRTLRTVAGILLAGLFGAAAWLVIVQEENERDWGDHDFVTVAGRLAGAGEDRATKAGFLLTLAAACVIAGVIAATHRRLPRRAATAALVPAAGIFLVWGLLFGSLAGTRPDTGADVVVPPPVEDPPIGLFGLEAGWVTPVLAAPAAYVAAVIMVRIVRLTASAHWWQPNRYQEVPIEAGSLELAEQRREDRLPGAG